MITECCQKGDCTPPGDGVSRLAVVQENVHHVGDSGLVLHTEHHRPGVPQLRGLLRPPVGLGQAGEQRGQDLGQVLVERLARHRGQDGERLGVDGGGGQLRDEVGQHRAGLDGHDLPQPVQRVVVQLGVGEVLQHGGQDVVQRAVAHNRVQGVECARGGLSD